MRGLPLLVMLGLCASAWSATVYKWTDDNGVVHFSDQPNPKAQKIEVSGAQTYGSKAAAVAAPPSATPAAPPAEGIAVCVIDSPNSGQVLLDTFSLSGHVTLAHVDSGGASVALRMDGQDLSALISGNGSFQLDQLARGEHTLTLQVTNAKGEVICEAIPVTFSVRQASAAAGAAGGPNGAPAAPLAPQAPKAPGVGGR